MRVTRWLRAHPRVLAGSFSTLAILGWQFIGAPAFRFLPSPTEIAGVFVEQRGGLWLATSATGAAALIGFFLGCGIAVALALIALFSRSVEAAVLRLGLALYSVPIIVIAPLFVLWLGAGQKPRIALSALAVFFGVLVGTIRGLRAVTQQSRDLMHVLSANGFQVFRFLRIPFALPYIMNALKIAAPAAVFGAIVGEWVGADRGLGVVLIYSLFQFQVPTLWAAMVLTTAIALGGYALIGVLEQVAMPWHESVRAARLETR